ncbi:MAG TPA: class I SAM-dependent methyltransferase [Aldersonia sp.]
MSFDVPADAYGRFMGVYSEPLAVRFVDFAGITEGTQVLDVGCGPGALTAELVRRGASVLAIDPSEVFVGACRARVPEADVRLGSAETLPFDDGSADAALAQLVVNFMPDPVAGLRQMARCTRPGGVVAACVWDHAGDSGALSLFWDAVAEVDPDEPGEATQPGSRGGDLVEFAVAAGLNAPEQDRLTVEAHFDDVDEWWSRFLLGVGPAGEYVTRLDDAGAALLRAACARRLPEGPLTLPATAWAMRARR